VLWVPRVRGAQGDVRSVGGLQGNAVEG
jgi:hypothetical protein